MKGIKVSTIFSVLWFILLLSRIYVISGVYSFPIDPTLIQIIYVMGIITLSLVVQKEIFMSKKNDIMRAVIVLFVIYWVLFGFIFVNPVMKEYTNGMVQRQGLFLAVVIVTVSFIKKQNLFNNFVRTSFSTVSLVLIFQFFTNISDVTKINIFNLFNTETRSRVNFGLGHYNNLGAICVCGLILGSLIVRLKVAKKKEKSIIYCLMFLMLLMLLGSASRNSVTGILIFVLVEIYLNLEKYALGKIYKNFIKIIIVMAVFIIGFWGMSGISIENLLIESNRMTLFSVALPTFFKSGRTWIGLGLASGEIYGQNLTSYKTYWMDNGYIYTLITSGYIGAIIYTLAAVLLLWGIYKMSKENQLGKIIMGIYIMYLFGALFETTLFNGGVVQNYIYIPIFLMCTSNKFIKKIKNIPIRK